MYAGHFAAGLALKARYPATPTWIPLLGVGVLDLLFGPFVLLGIERLTMTPGVGPGFSLDFIDWSHSLGMSVVWSVAFALLFVRWNREVAMVAGVAVFSHFMLDLPMHPPDLALWPGADTHLGLGLWHRLPTGWWFVELGAIAAGCAYYWLASRRHRTFGRRAGWVIAVIVALHLMNAPFFRPAG